MEQTEAIDPVGKAFAQISMPTPPRAVPPSLGTLEQRLALYREACNKARASGDDRKARMHDRIAKQYQTAIQAHKAGRPVNFEELPVPPGFPPILGLERERSLQGFAAVLEADNKLYLKAGKEDDGIEKEGELHVKKPSATQKSKKPTLAVCPIAHEVSSSSAQLPLKEAQKEGLSSEANQQLGFPDGCRKQHMKVKPQANQQPDLKQDRDILHTTKSGNARDVIKEPLSLVSSQSADEDDDFVVVNHSDIQISQRIDQVYSHLSKQLKEQHEKCIMYSRRFSHLGNITETMKFEKMAEGCKKNMEILELSQAQGWDPPKYFFEERTYNTTRMFPELSSTEMVVTIVRGMNLPAPRGLSAQHLNSFVKFEFPYPNAEQPQSHKTTVVRNTSSPEYNQSFTLTINRNHRGFRRVIQSKGLKLEVLHKGGFLRSDKPLGSALLKLEKLETGSELREIVEVTEGRKATGGRLEVRVRLREPLSGQDMQVTTESWLVLEPTQVTV